MKSFTRIETTLLPLDRTNVDTDAIIPQQYLKSVKRTGFGVYLFDNWRYRDPGVLGQDPRQRRIDPDFVLNQTTYKAAKILLARANFGCGSSREHAVWSILDYGFEVVISSSFADIFCSNSYKNGLLPVTLEEAAVDYLFKQVAQDPAFTCTVDLETQIVLDANDKEFSFEINEFHKYCLLNGYDEIDLTLQHADKIKLYEAELKQSCPWLFR
ncbi:MAG: 3-isopropylmalate dehydratase small subunit [Gammaproteobacteria bacterium]|nr:3-isopropylmalate dehydratase small subunit [Gammaproteobacteria bacterium]